MTFVEQPSKLVERFMDRGIHLTPEALEEIKDVPESSVRDLMVDLRERKDRPSIITDTFISKLLESEEAIPAEASVGCESSDISGKNEASVEGEEPSVDKKPEISGKEVERPREGLKIHKDITDKSTSKGEIEDFIQLFRDRYEVLSGIIRSRENFQSYTEMSNIARHEGDMVNLVGLVRSKRETRKKDAWLIEMEDPTGKAVVYIKDSDRNEEVLREIGQVVTDEVIGVKAKVPGNLKSGGRDPLVWGNEIYWPEVPLSGPDSVKRKDTERASGYAVLISDLHVGSKMFLPKVFEKFINWLKGEAGNKRQREISKKVKYLIIAGDLVDGIGIYPGQKKELEIVDVYRQYERVASLLSEVPEDITIIAAPGNHDAVRLAEPQPALSNDVAAPLKDIDVELVGNPSYVSLEGVTFLLYHGMGFDDLISADLALDRENVVNPMERMLKKRHLAPIYGEPMGGKTPISPESEDYLVIDGVPDVLHCGHLHRYGCGKYRGVIMINSATFQSQTIFMKRQGINPTPGRVPIVNLETKETRAINFA